VFRSDWPKLSRLQYSSRHSIVVCSISAVVFRRVGSSDREWIPTDHNACASGVLPYPWPRGAFASPRHALSLLSPSLPSRRRRVRSVCLLCAHPTTSLRHPLLLDIPLPREHSRPATPLLSNVARSCLRVVPVRAVVSMEEDARILPPSPEPVVPHSVAAYVEAA